jgi:hypothetical protein
MSTDRRFVDLHTHSTASDGTLSPAEVVALADAANLAAVALTDHDTTSGLAEARAAAASSPGLRFVPGVEVSARYSPGMMHILGLGIAETSQALRKLLAGFIDARDQRNPKILAKLHDLGIEVGMDDVLAAAESFEPGRPHVIGRMHIAEAMRVKGYAQSIQDAFTRYLSNGGIAFVDKERLEPRGVIEGIIAGGGIAVLAHPVQLKLGDGKELEDYVRRLAGWGLGGIEVYHPDHSDQQTRHYLDLARALGLMVTGGSDFHGAAKPGVAIGRPRVPLAAITGPLAEMVAGSR